MSADTNPDSVVSAQNGKTSVEVGAPYAIEVDHVVKKYGDFTRFLDCWGRTERGSRR